MAYQFIHENKGEFAVKEMAGLLGVSREAYYQWVRRGFSERQAEMNAELLRLIQEIVDKHYHRYGILRVRKELLNKYGKCVSRKKVARLMRENGLNARRRRKYVKTTDSKHSLPVCENILNQEFYAEKPSQKWVSDITYLRTTDGWLYFTVTIDLFDRKVIGWSFSDSMETVNTTVPALMMAVTNRTPMKDLIFHSDRGVQYCAYAFRDTLCAICPTVRQSMSRKGNCWDNACAESFFKTLKCELETLEGKHSEAEVRQSVFMYIESYYNRIRMHSALDYVAPNVYHLEKVA
jgi:transposase InsO family protein